MKSNISVWFGIFGIVTSLNIIFINRSFSQIDSVNANKSSFVDSAIDIQSRIERFEADVALIEKSMRQATLNIYKKFIPKQESLYKDYTLEWRTFSIELFLLPAKQTFIKNMRTETLILVAEKISVSAKILLQSDKLEADLRAELEAVKGFQPDLKKAAGELQKMLSEKSKLWTDAKESGLLPDVEIDPTDGSFTIKSPTRTKQKPVGETDRAVAFMDACVANPTLMKGESDTAKTSVCRCIVDRMPTAGQAIKAEDISKSRDACVAISRPLPSKIGSWVISRDGDGKPRASSQFRGDYPSETRFKQLDAFCKDGTIVYQFVGNIDKIRSVQKHDHGDGVSTAVIFNYDNQGVFDLQSSRRMTVDLRSDENIVAKFNKGKTEEFVYGFMYRNRDIKTSRMPNGSLGMDNGEIWLNAYRSTQMIEILSERCKSR